MIASIVELPNLLWRTDELLAFQQCATGDFEEYAPSNILLTQGRNISLGVFAVLPTKYRIDFMINNTNHYLIVMSLERLNTDTLLGMTSGLPTPIYPLYGKIYQRHILFTQRINQFFQATSCCSCSPHTSNQVMSTMDFINSIDHAIGANGEPTLKVGMDGDFPGASPIIRNDPLMEIMNELLTDLQFSNPWGNLSQQFRITQEMIPPEIAMVIQGATQSTDLLRFDSPTRRVKSDVQIAVEFSRENWEETSRRIHDDNAVLSQTTDNILPCTPEDNSRMGLVLGSIADIPAEDFWFDVRSSLMDTSDFYIKKINPYTGFSRTTERLHGWDTLVHNLIYAVDLLGKFPGTVMVAHKSCLEDLTVYDRRTNKILLYIDLVWWTLASANGLINKGICDYF